MELVTDSRTQTLKIAQVLYQTHSPKRKSHEGK